MSESKKGIHQIGYNSFLFYNTPEIFYSLTLEIVDSANIKIILIKIQPTETYIYETTVLYSIFNTGCPNAKEALKNISFIIYNYNFVLKEEENKVRLTINSKSEVNLELFLHKTPNSDDNGNNNIKNEEINNMQNKIQQLLNTISNQERQINELKQKEENYINRIGKIEQVANSLTTKINQIQNQSQNQNNNTNNNYNRSNTMNYNGNNNYNNNNMYNNNAYNNTNNNNFNSNNNNNYVNNPYGHSRTMTMQNMNSNGFGKNNVNVVKVYNPILPENRNINDLISRPQNIIPNNNNVQFQQKRTINLDDRRDEYKHY